MKYIALLLLIISLPLRADEYFCEKALTDYDSCRFGCSKILISAYSFALYSSMNRTLREGLNNPSCLEAAEKLHKAIRKLPKSKLMVYRGTVLTKELNQIRTGECFFDSGFMSTSANLNVAKKFGKNQALMIIEANSAREISKYSNIPREEEYILLPQTALKLVKDPSKENTLKVFSFKEVNRKECL